MTTPRRLEHSCGALVFQRGARPPLVLVVCSQRGGHWGFPKGHVEKGESVQQTALREILEETGVRARLLEETALERRHYGLPTGALKRVDYFLAEGSGQPRPQPGEISQALWVEPERALELLSFREDRRLLRKTLERYVKS